MREFRIDSKSVLSCEGRLIYGTNEESSVNRRAFLHGDILSFHAYLPRQLGATKSMVAIREDKTGNVLRFPMVWDGISEDDDIWKSDIPSEQIGIGLFYFRVEVQTIAGNAIAVRQGDKCSFRHYNDHDYTYQLLISDFRHPQPSWLLGGTIYQIFVDRFFRGKKTPVRKDAILNPDWENGIPQYPTYPGAPLENNMFFGGNLSGIEEKIPYLSSLGVTCIYLTPIFRAYSNHKYDTGNYMEIDEMFGGEAAFRSLLQTAKQAGIRIILDGVFNHTGDDSLYFNRKGKYPSVGAYQSKDSPYYEWYDFQKHPDNYTSWWGIDILPRINTQKESCREYFLGKSGVIRHYAEMGIGGFRLDVADELSDAFIQGVKEVLSDVSPDSVLYGEVWEDASNKIAYETRRQYFWGNELDGVMNYEIRRGIIRFIREGKCDALRYALCEVMPNTPKRVCDLQMNLIGTHDTARILTELSDVPAGTLSNAEKASHRMSEKERTEGVKKLQCAYAILATIPGIPMIYYGDEIGMEGYNDPFNRMPFTWHRVDKHLLNFYKSIGKLRAEHAVYREGTFRLLALSDDFLLFARQGTDAVYLTAVNVSTREITVRIKGLGLLISSQATYDGEQLRIDPMGCAVAVTSAKLERTLEIK